MNKKYLGHNLHMMYKIYQSHNFHNIFKIGRNLQQHLKLSIKISLSYINIYFC